jgi:membrane-associated protease RseP (regulator of RpoE activity)
MQDIFVATGVRTPFSRIDGALAAYDAIELSVPVAQAMCGRLRPGTLPDFVVWGSVVPNLGWSNIARETWLDAALDPRVPAYSVVLACATSVTAAIAAQTVALPRRWVRENNWPAATGVRIKKVARGSAASAVGLRDGDWIVGAQGEAIAEQADLLGFLIGDGAGRTLALKVLRPAAGVLTVVHVAVTPSPG